MDIWLFLAPYLNASFENATQISSWYVSFGILIFRSLLKVTSKVDHRPGKVEIKKANIGNHPTTGQS